MCAGRCRPRARCARSALVSARSSGNIGELNVDFTGEVKRARCRPHRAVDSSKPRSARRSRSPPSPGERRFAASHRRAGGIKPAQGRARLAPRPGTVTKGAGTQSRSAAIAGQQSTPPSFAIAKANVETPATLAQHQATLDSARINLSAPYPPPIDGVVIDRTVEVGRPPQRASAPKLFTIAQTYPMCRSKPR